jgi:hypothetical protein
MPGNAEVVDPEDVFADAEFICGFHVVQTKSLMMFSSPWEVALVNFKLCTVNT